MIFLRRLLGLSLSVLGIMTASAQSIGDHYIAAWSPSMSAGGQGFHDQTVRMVVHASVGGHSLRLHLSNLRGDAPLVVGKLSLAMQDRGAVEVMDSRHLVTVSQAASFVIPAGAETVSDAIPVSIEAGQNLLVSLYLPRTTGASTWHSDAFDTSYVAEFDHVDDSGDAAYSKSTTSWYYLSGLDVRTEGSGAVVAFGDSITDGYDTPHGAYARWPDDLARRLAENQHPMGVVDAGIGGNRVLTDVPNLFQGVSAIKRFKHDALDQAGARTVILMEGINDIGNDTGPGNTPLTAQAMIDGYRQLIAKARGAGLRILGGTMLPFKGAGYYSSTREAIRQACNRWIRHSGAFDGVVDFEQALRDPSNHQVLRPEYDSGDHLHPNAAGMQAMADAVNLRLMR
jgi:lysophospholipase L1-like esterase